MSPSRLQTPLRPIELDVSAALQFEHGLGRAELLQFAPRLEEARQDLLQVSADDGEPLIGGPRRLLEQYREGRRASPLGQILGAAKRLRDSADRVVILGSPASVAAAEAVVTACSHPFHNELSRGQRGGRPRIYFLPADADNDRLAGLLDILPADAASGDVDDRWAIVAIDDGGSADLLVASLESLWSALQNSCGDESGGQCAVKVGRRDSRLAAIVKEHGCQHLVEHDDLGGAIPVGTLLAASITGLDIVQLLRGAAAMAERYTTAPVGDNPVLDLAGVFHLLHQRRHISARQIEPPEAALRPLVNCYSQTAGFANSHAGECVLLQITPDDARRDPLRVTMPGRGQCTLPELADRQAETIRAQRAAAGQPTIVIRPAGLDEASIGQLIQLLWLSMEVEKRLG